VNQGAVTVIMWPLDNVRLILAAVVISALSIGINQLWSPNVAPVTPAEFGSSEREDLAVSGLESDESLDFIFRPLFIASRKPPVQNEAAPEIEKTADTSTQTPDALAGYRLLGVFSSGDTAGAIVSHEKNGRQRVYLGQTLEGWALHETSVRVVHFVNTQGDRISLELAVASSLPALPSVALMDRDTADVSGDDGQAAPGSVSKLQSPAPPVRRDGPVTFDSIGVRKKTDREEARKKGVEK